LRWIYYLKSKKKIVTNVLFYIISLPFIYFFYQ
jgi:hypothetical protein